MKRLNLWLRELSLTQQLLAIIFVFLAIFSILLVTFMTPMIDALSGRAMFSLLHASQQATLPYITSSTSLIPSDTNDAIIQSVYKDDRFIMLTSDNYSVKLRENIIYRLQNVKDGFNDFVYTYPMEEKTEMYIYVISKIDEDAYLVSVIDNEYREGFQRELFNQVVSMNVFIVSILFVILLIWVFTLIVPLSQIKAYITKLKKDEQAELYVKRRDAIGEVADALREMDAELKRQNKEKQEMVQNISHDLKTPIATIKSYGESIKDGIYPYDTLEKSVDVIIEHADRLQKKVQSLIVLNKMDYLADDIAEDASVDMNAIIDKVILSLKVIRPKIQLLKECEEEVYFHGTSEPWRIVVENLIDNGLRYAKTEVKVILKDSELRVVNDGSQIKNEELDRIFRPYEKGTNGRFGLGLSIVRKVCVTYGYQVEAENLPGKVCFRIWKDEKRHKRKHPNKERKAA